MKGDTLPHLHFTGACGRALGPLALDLKRAGWSLTASDAVQYAPMAQFLRKAGLPMHRTFSARHVPQATTLLVTGAGVAPGNPELDTALRRGIPVCNMAQLVGQHLVHRARRLVVAGTKGKTTTTAMLAWILDRAGKQPDYLIGGVCPHFPLSVRMRGSRWAVLEGDEYPSGKEDPTPKFHHYRPHGLIVTNVRLDHPEIYASLRQVKAEFQTLCRNLPATGRLILNAQCPHALSLQKATTATVETVGWHPDAQFRLSDLDVGPHGTRFTLCNQAFSLPLTGRMIALDAALAARAALLAGVSLKSSAAALAEFQGVLGRMQPILTDDRLVFVLDETYHPLAIAENLAALKKRFPGRRLVVAIQPRYTGGRDGFQQKDLPKALAGADHVILLAPFDHVRFPAGPFSNRLLAADLRRLGVVVATKPKTVKALDFCPPRLRRGDLFYCSLPPGCDFFVSPLTQTLKKDFLT